MIPLTFVEVRVNPELGVPVLLLREAAGPRHLPVWISAAGGNAILQAIEGAADAPSTHDLMLETLSVLDAIVESVRLLGVDDGVFAAELSVNGHAVPCRVSDGIALALRCGAPVLAAESLLERAGVLLEDPAASEDPEEQVEQFRSFLDQIKPDDFGTQP